MASNDKKSILLFLIDTPLIGNQWITSSRYDIVAPAPSNVRNHRAATSDCPFENARHRGSGALLCYAVTSRLAVLGRRRLDRGQRRILPRRIP